MDWAAHADTWPNAAASRFVQARPHRWHVQIMGPEDAPALLLLHGTGGATHSWRDLAPCLARRWRVVAPDLPGHGFTRAGALQRFAPDLMAQDIATLLDRLGCAPVAILGHSAGMVLALYLAQRLAVAPQALVGLAPALENFSGTAGWLFPVMARTLALNPLVAPGVAAMATPGSVRAMIAGTGSPLGPEACAQYHACVSDADHVAGALRMMAGWRLGGVAALMAANARPTLLIAGARDAAVPVAAVRRAAEMMAQAQLVVLPEAGHLAHEEAPDEVGALITGFLAQTLGPAPPGGTTS